MGAKINLLFPLTSRSVWGTMGHKRRDHMCRAASFVVTKDKVFWSKMTDSHEEIIREFDLCPEVAGKACVVRCEIVP